MKYSVERFKKTAKFSFTVKTHWEWVHTQRVPYVDAHINKSKV